MNYLSWPMLGLMAVLLTTACAEKRAASDSGYDMYVVSDGLLVLDTDAAAQDGVRVLDDAGQP